MTTTNSALRPSREALMTALSQCKEKQEFHKKETERLEEEEKLLEAELRHADLEPLHDRLAVMNASLHDCLERKELHPEENKYLEERYQRLLLERKRALLPDAQTGEESLVGIASGVFAALTQEERRKRGYVLAALREPSFHWNGDDLDTVRFDEIYPEFSDDGEFYLERLKNGHMDFLYNRRYRSKGRRAHSLPEIFHENQDIVLAHLQQKGPKSVDCISERLMVSDDFFAKLLTETNLCSVAYNERLFEKIFEIQGFRQAVSVYPRLAAVLIRHESNSFEQRRELTFKDKFLISLFDDVFVGAWPREVLLEWARAGRFIPSDYRDFCGKDREIAIMSIASWGVLLAAPELFDEKSFVLQSLKVCSYDLSVLSESMKYDFDVLLVAMSNFDHQSSFFRLVYGFAEAAESSFIGFDDRLYAFGQQVREIMARTDSFDAFLEASNNLCGLGLDVDTTAAMVRKISAFVGVPTQNELTRLRTALVVTKKMGY